MEESRGKSKGNGKKNSVGRGIEKKENRGNSEVKLPLGYER